jgi:hypothetical protein
MNDEFTERCDAIFDRIKANLEQSHRNEFVAIEPDSGEHFLGPTLSEASSAARKIHPDRQTFVYRIGHRATVHIGAHLRWGDA